MQLKGKLVYCILLGLGCISWLKSKLLPVDPRLLALRLVGNYVSSRFRWQLPEHGMLLLGVEYVRVLLRTPYLTSTCTYL